MAKQLGSGSGSTDVQKTLNQGLSNKAAKFPDSSMGMKGGKSVNDDTTRSSVAPTPRGLGPRVA
jgi:hypothetical protein